MKKILLGMAVGAMALGAAVSPVAAGNPEADSIWTVIDDNDNDGTLSDLILLAGLVPTLDACGNGKPMFTFFAPDTSDADVELYPGGPTVSIDWADALLGGLGLTLSDLSQTPAVVLAVLNDHIVNGSVSPYQIENPSVTRLVARSGYVLHITREEDVIEASDEDTFDGADYDDAYVDGIEINSYDEACNGFIYWIDGVIDSTPQVITGGLNQGNNPTDGSATAANPNGSLPDTL